MGRRLNVNDLDRMHRIPRMDAATWVAPGAIVLGDVVLGARSSVWFGTVIRGDTELISVGADTNLQEQVILHADPGFPCMIGERVTVGHGAIIHGATIEQDSLIGMRATVLNGAVVGAGSVVAAGALVPEGRVYPPRSLIVGMPARRVREISEADQARIARGWQHYVQLAGAYAAKFGRLGERFTCGANATQSPPEVASGVLNSEEAEND